MLNATVTSVGSSMNEASCLRAQLAALNEKVKVLEAKQAPQPDHATGAVDATQAAGAAGSEQTVGTVSAAQAAGTVGSDAVPTKSGGEGP